MSNNQIHIYINQDDDLIITLLPGLAASATSFVSASLCSQDSSSTTVNLFLEIILHSFLPGKINTSSQISFLSSLALLVGIEYLQFHLYARTLLNHLILLYLGLGLFSENVTPSHSLATFDTVIRKLKVTII